MVSPFRLFLRLVLCLGLFLMLSFSFAAASTWLKVFLEPDIPLAYANEIKFGIQWKKENGKIKHTPGLLRGGYDWSNYLIEVSHGRVENGRIYIYRDQANKSGYLRLSIQHIRFEHIRVDTLITIPKVKALKVACRNCQDIRPGNRIQFEIGIDYGQGKVYTAQKPLVPGFPHKGLFSYRILDREMDFEAYLPPMQKELPAVVPVHITYLPDPSIQTVFEVPVDYRIPVYFDFRGKNGRSFHRKYQYRNGQPGESVKLFVQHHIRNGAPFLRLKAVSPTRTRTAWVQMPGGTVLIDCTGGHGGAGQEGHDGIWGDDGLEMGNFCADGMDGQDGQPGGNGGPGGNLQIFADAASRPYLEAITLLNHGGPAGPGGKGGDGGEGGIPWGDDGNPGANGAAGAAGRSGLALRVVILSNEDMARAMQAYPEP
ncbi:MAG: hypothetical protein AAFR61_30840 [Bacteroidota bacterium]